MLLFQIKNKPAFFEVNLKYIMIWHFLDIKGNAIKEDGVLKNRK